MSGDYVLRFVTRDECGLCAEAFALLARHARRGGVRLVVVDVDSNPQLLEQYAERVPVVLAADDAVLAEGRIDTRTAKRAVARARLPLG